MTNTDKVIEEFKKILGGYCYAQDGGNGGYDYEDIMNFIDSLIRTALDNQKTEILKAVDEIVIDKVGDSAATLQQVRDAISKI